MKLCARFGDCFRRIARRRDSAPDGGAPYGTGCSAGSPKDCIKEITLQKSEFSGLRFSGGSGLSTLPRLRPLYMTERRPESRLMTRMINATTSRT